MTNWVFRVLGTLEVAGPCGPVRLNRARERTILAVLLLNANRLVPAERLVDAVWPQSPPSTARGQIHICVSNLRRLLADAGLPDRIATRSPGYLLKVGDGELDLHAFERDAAAGLEAARTAGDADAVATLRRAVALFAEEPFADVDSPVVRSVAMRLLERRMSVAEEYLEAEIRRGRHADLLEELSALVASHPLRERLRVLQMTALHRTGRRAEALAAYQEARRGLVQELGVEPGPDLRRVQMDILAEHGYPPTAGFDPTAGRAVEPMPVPRLLPSDIADFVDHDGQLNRLRADLLRPVRAGRPSSTMEVVAISGGGGVGKTAFARRLAHELTGHFTDGQLYARLRAEDGQAVSPQRILVRFLRALGVAGGSSGRRGLEECTEVYRDWTAGRRILVVLDDACDERQVSPLLPASASCTVVVTSRARLAGLPGAWRVHLDMPDTDRALDMLAGMVGRGRVAAEPAEALELVRRCGRLPLALRAAAARLNARPHWTIGQFTARLGDRRRRLDELCYAGHDVRASILVGYQGLDPVGRRLLARLALCGAASLPGWIAAPLLDSDPDAGMEALDRLVDAQLVDVRWVAGQPRYRMHDLVRLFAEERLAAEDPMPERLAALRRVVATGIVLVDEANHPDPGGRGSC